MSGKNNRLLSFLISGLLLMSAAFAQAVTVCKDGSCEYTTIREGLLNTPKGGTVTVSPSTESYMEGDLSVVNKTLTTETPDTKGGVTIDATGTNKVVISAAQNASIIGFTIRGGKNDVGGGIVLGGGAVTLQNLIIEANISTGGGGGVGTLTGTSSLNIVNSDIRNNTATGGGGGIGWLAGGILKIVNNSKIEDNTVLDSSIGRTFGGGILITSIGSTLIIEDSTISGNKLMGSRSNRGAGIDARGTTTLKNVRVLNNNANAAGSVLEVTTGGGIAKTRPTGSGTSLSITGGTISGNQADKGGGVWVGNTSRLVLSGGDINGNVALEGIPGVSGGGIFCQHVRSLESLTGSVSGNSPDEIVGCNTGTGPGDPAEPTPADKEQSGTDADPVNTFTGDLFNQYQPDINLGGPMPLFFSRYYSSALLTANITGTMGDNWRHYFEWTLTHIGNEIHIINHQGRSIEFTKTGLVWDLSGSTDIAYQLVENAGIFTLLDPRSDTQYTLNVSGQLIGISDGKGNVHTLSYNGANQLISVTDDLGRTLTMTYDGTGKLSQVSDGTRNVTFVYTGSNLTSVTDAEAKVTTYAYDLLHATSGLLTSTTRPATNSPFTQTWNADGQVATQTDASSNTTTFNYTGLNTTMTGPTGNTRVHSHTATGEFSNRTDQAGLSFSMGSDTTGRRNSITDRMGATTSLSYHAESGQVGSVINADGTTTSNAYTARLAGGITHYDLTGITHEDGTTESFTYDAAGNLTSFVDQAGNPTSGSYNAKGQPLTATNVAGGITTHIYNADGTRLSTSDPAGNLSTFGYDALRRLNLMTHPDLTTQSVVYDNENRPLTAIDENGNTLTMSYDDNGNLASITDPLLKTTAFTYDGNDRLLSTTDPLAGVTSQSYDPFGRIKTLRDENNNVITLGYNTLGRLTSVTDPLGKIATFTYDPEAIPTSSTDPLGNTTSFASDVMGRITQTTSPLGNIFAVTYDSIGRIATSTDPLGNTTTLSRDARGLLSGLTLPGAISASYARNALGDITALTDPGGNVWSRSYDNMGRETASTDPLANSQSIAYDNRNRPATITFPGGLGSLSLAYDPVGNLSSSSFSDGTLFNFVYDANSRLTSANGITRGYDAKGRIINSNGIAIIRDAGGRMTQMTLAVGKALNYLYDANDRVTQITDWLGGITNFVYDDAGRLTGITRPNTINATKTYDNDNRLTGLSEGAISSISLTRDANGQITAATRTVPQTASATGLSSAVNTFDAASQVSGNSYDAMGRLTAAGTNTFTWNLASQLTTYTVGGSTVTATYDAFGRRLSRTESGSTRNFVWNDALALPSISIERQGGTDFRYFIHTPGGQLLYSMDATTNARSFYHYDEMGNTIFITSDAGAIIGSYAYTPFGQRIASTGSLDNPFTWQGAFGVVDEGKGFYYIRARYYDAAVGRFISRDSVKSIRPKSINPYQYALTNPLRFVDVTGRESIFRLRLKLFKAQVEFKLADRRTKAAKRAFRSIASQAPFISKSDIAAMSTEVSILDRSDPSEANVSFLRDDIRETFSFADGTVKAGLAFLDASIRLQSSKDSLKQARKSLILHLKKILDQAEEKVSKAKETVKKTGTRTQHTARKKTLQKSKAKRDQALKNFLGAGGIIEPYSVIPEISGVVTLG